MRIRCWTGVAAHELAVAWVRPLAAMPLVLSVALSGCSGSGPGAISGPTSSYDSKWGVSSSARLVSNGPVPKGGGHYKLGRPYQIGGRWYVPRHEPYYDRVGVGSWYGTEFHGRKTANGELYDMNALTAAHPTLPLPSYAYVTNQRNGHTILVRINDRGPYVADREIDLSRASARALGYAEGGLGKVRVRWAGHAPLNGDDRREQAFLRNQPWNGGPRVAARFDRPTPPAFENRERAPPQRYAQDMNRRNDAQEQRNYGAYDQPRDDRRRYDDARYDRAPAQRYVAEDEPRRGSDFGQSNRPAARQSAAEYDDAEQSQPRRNAIAAPAEPAPAFEPDAPMQPDRPAAPQQMWSPFDHREQVKSARR